MPLAALRPCPVPRCPALTRGGKCDQHKAKAQNEADRQRGSAKDRGYDYRWSLFSKGWRAKYPMCGMRAGGRLDRTHSQCLQQGRQTVSDLVVDHIQPLSEGGEQYDEANLQTLCRACNSAKDGWGK